MPSTPVKDLSNWPVFTFQIFRIELPDIGVPGREELLPGRIVAVARFSVPGCQERPFSDTWTNMDKPHSPGSVPASPRAVSLNHLTTDQPELPSPTGVSPFPRNSR